MFVWTIEAGVYSRSTAKTFSPPLWNLGKVILLSLVSASVHERFDRRPTPPHPLPDIKHFEEALDQNDQDLLQVQSKDLLVRQKKTSLLLNSLTKKKNHCSNSTNHHALNANVSTTCPRPRTQRQSGCSLPLLRHAQFIKTHRTAINENKPIDCARCRSCDGSVETSQSTKQNVAAVFFVHFKTTHETWIQ
jgi:hypothetical protein